QIQVKLENVDVVDALDFVSLESGSIWEVMDNHTIVVGSDNETVRRDLQRRIAKTIPVTNASPQGITEFITALRTILNIRQVAEGSDAVVVEDTQSNRAMAEKMIADLNEIAKR